MQAKRDLLVAKSWIRAVLIVGLRMFGACSFQPSVGLLCDSTEGIAEHYILPRITMGWSPCIFFHCSSAFL